MKSNFFFRASSGNQPTGVRSGILIPEPPWEVEGSRSKLDRVLVGNGNQSSKQGNTDSEPLLVIKFVCDVSPFSFFSQTACTLVLARPSTPPSTDSACIHTSTSSNYLPKHASSQVKIHTMTSGNDLTTEDLLASASSPPLFRCSGCHFPNT